MKTDAVYRINSKEVITIKRYKNLYYNVYKNNNLIGFFPIVESIDNICVIPRIKIENDVDNIMVIYCCCLDYIVKYSKLLEADSLEVYFNEEDAYYQEAILDCGFNMYLKYEVKPKIYKAVKKFNKRCIDGESNNSSYQRKRENK